MTMKLIVPQNHRSRLALLRRAVWSANEQKEGALAIEPALVEEMSVLLGRYDTNQGVIAQVAASLSEARIERRRKARVLARVVRQFFAVVRARTARLGHDPVVMEYFGMTRGLTPNIPTSLLETAQLVERLVAGEAGAVAKELPAMANPGIDEVQTALAEARDAEHHMLRTLQRYNGLRDESRELAALATDILARLARRLRVTLERKSRVAKRECMRYFGYRFQGDPVLENSEPPPADPPGEEPESPIVDPVPEEAAPVPDPVPP